jgi:hypothetical protein
MGGNKTVYQTERFIEQIGALNKSLKILNINRNGAVSIDLTRRYNFVFINLPTSNFPFDL